MQPFHGNVHNWSCTELQESLCSSIPKFKINTSNLQKALQRIVCFLHTALTSSWSIVFLSLFSLLHIRFSSSSLQYIYFILQFFSILVSLLWNFYLTLKSQQMNHFRGYFSEPDANFKKVSPLLRFLEDTISVQSVNCIYFAYQSCSLFT
jgi:hypothetical protein